MKFLIDECLSPKLCEFARARGFVESSHVVWLGRSGAKDWELFSHIVAQDWTFVTKNASDFRGLAEDPGHKGQYARADLHAGLICLNGPVGMNRALQLELFELALAELMAKPDLVNQVLEVFLEDDTTLRVTRYQLP